MALRLPLDKSWALLLTYLPVSARSLLDIQITFFFQPRLHGRDSNSTKSSFAKDQHVEANPLVVWRLDQVEYPGCLP